MTIIFSNMGDSDCFRMHRIWQGIDNLNLVEITSQTENAEEIVDTAIMNEHDTLILCGHGSIHGLFFPDFNRGEYIVHMGNVNLINAKNVICLWCYASTFCMDHMIPSISSSMFISNINEAYDNCINVISSDDIDRENNRFFDEINYLLVNNIPLSEWVMRLGAHMDIENDLDVFNRQGLTYI